MADLQAAIEEALRLLLQRSTRNAFVIFEDKATKRFVQFAHTRKHGLLLDLPGVALDAGQMERATEYFGRYGVQPREGIVVASPDGKTGGHERIFQVSFGDRANKAAEVAVALFERVYQLTGDWELVITTEPSGVG